MATDKKSQMIKVKINLTKINKDWLFQGEKGTYLDATLWFTEEQDDNGNNGMITQDVPKAIWEKDKQVRGTILGNGKVWGARPAITAEEKVGSTEGLTKASDEALDDLPF